MKRILLRKNFLFLILFCTMVSFGQTGTAISMVAGTNNASAFGANCTVGSDGATYYVSWDATYLYLGWSAGNTNYSSDMYYAAIDTDPYGTNGSSNAVQGVGFQTLGRLPDYYVAYENNSSFYGSPATNGNAYELYSNNSGAWNFVSRTAGNDNTSSRVNFAGSGGEVRLRLTWASLGFTPGSSSPLGITLWTNNSSGNFMWGRFPSANPGTGSTPKTLTHSIIFPSTASGINTSTHTGYNFNRTLAPSTQGTMSASTNTTNNTLQINWTGAGNGQGRTVVVRPASATAVAPSDGTGYTANTSVVSAPTTGVNNFVVYSGSAASNGILVTGLAANTSYVATMYEYNGAISIRTYFTTGAPSQTASTTNTAPSILSTDNAGNYTSGAIGVTDWIANSNKGTNLGAWTFDTSGTGSHFVGNSSINAGGSSGNINSTGNKAWGIAATSLVRDAVRPFNPLLVDQYVQFDMDNGYIDSGKLVGFSLRNSANQNLMEFYFVGGNASYTLNDATGVILTGISFTGNGLRVKITRASSTTYNIAVYSASNLVTPIYTVNDRAFNNSGNPIPTKIRFFNANAGNNSDQDAFYNNITTSSCITYSGVTQPATACLSGTGSATIRLSGLLDGSHTISYTVNNGATLTETASASAGVADFTIPNLTTSNDGQTLAITQITSGSCTQPLSYNNTVVLNVKSPPTLNISGAITPACGQTTVNLTSVVTTNGTVSYFSDNGYSVAVPDATLVSTSGIYYVRATSAFGCNTDGTITVNAFKPNPIVSITGASSICAITGTTTLSPTTGGTWVSSNDSIATVSNAGAVSAGATTGSVTFTFTNSTTGCSATTANVTVTAQPQWYLDADGDGYYTGSAVSSCTSPGAGYTTTVLGGGDCNDDPSAVNPLGVPSSAIHPNATEVCYNNIDDDCDGFFSESCPAVVVNMTPATTITNFSIALSAVPYTYPGASSLGYRFWIRNLTSGQIREVNMPTRFVTIPSDIRSYNTLYELRAAAIINGEIVSYAGNTITVISPSIQLVQLSATSCNSTLASIGSTISASPGPNALTYTFRIRLASDNSPTPTYGEVTLGSRFVNSNSFIGMPLQYNTVYAVSVKYTFNNNDGLGVQESGWGAECTLTTPGIPVIGLSSPMCGSTLSSMNSTISANPALYAIQYRFRMRLSSSNPSLPESYSTSLPANSRFTYMSALQQQFPLEYAKSYYVSVQYSITNNSVEQWSNYGPECLLSTPALPFATIVGDCEAGLTPASSSELIYSTTYAGASGYRFILQRYDEESELIYDQYEDRVTNNFSLSMFSGLESGQTYYLSVWVIMNGQPVDGGINPCEIDIPFEGKAVIASPFAAKAYPNPFASNFLIDVTTESKSAVNIKVYDMVGRLVEEQSVQVTDMKTSPIGNQFPSGVYNVIITQDNEVQTLRVVKR